MAASDPKTQDRAAPPAGSGSRRDDAGTAHQDRPRERNGTWSPAQAHEGTAGVGDEHVVDIDGADDPSKD